MKPLSLTFVEGLLRKQGLFPLPVPRTEGGLQFTDEQREFLETYARLEHIRELQAREKADVKRELRRRRNLRNGNT